MGETRTLLVGVLVWPFAANGSWWGHVRLGPRSLPAGTRCRVLSTDGRTAVVRVGGIAFRVAEAFLAVREGPQSAPATVDPPAARR